MNPLGTVKQFEELIRQGYGYTQLLQKLNLTDEDIKNLVAQFPAFALVIKARYGIIIEPNKEPEQPKPAKSLKRKKKEEPKQEQHQETSDGEVTDAKDSIPEGE